MPPVPRIFPPPEPPAPPAPPPPPAPSRRDGVLVAGLTVMAGSAVLSVLAALLTLISNAGDAVAPGWSTASSAADLVADGLVAGAWVAATLAFRVTGRGRTQLLVTAAVLVAVSSGIDVLGAGLSIAGDRDDDTPGAWLASDLVGLAGATVLLGVGAAAAAAFSGPRPRRDPRLAWAAVGFGGYVALEMLATALLAVAFADLGVEGGLLTGLWVASAGQVFAIGGATLAGAGLLHARDRDALLNRALALWGATNLLTAIGGFVTAAAMDDVRYRFSATDVASMRVSALSALVAVAGAVLLAEAFRRRAAPA